MSISLETKDVAFNQLMFISPVTDSPITIKNIKMRQKESPTAITTNEKMTYFLMNEDEALAEITKTTKEVNEILGLTSTTLVRLILNYFRWDKNTLTDRFYEDPDKLFRTLNVANPDLSPSLQWNPLSPGCGIIRDPMLTAMETDDGNNECRTCYFDKPANEFILLPCRHKHCVTCWQGYLESNIVHGSGAQSISCPSRCNQIIDDEEILKLLINKENLRERYRRFLIDTFVETNRLTRWCPGDRCITIVKMKSYHAKCAQVIECDMCKTIFCFECRKQWHEPIQCSLLLQWEQKNGDESMTGKWILANTKECPECRSSIEKNGGCNHMTCRRPGCGHEFCWLCFGDWKNHPQCNVYREEDSEKSQSEAREVLARYIHYFARYQTHNQSLVFEGKLSEQVEKRKKEMQDGAMSYTDQKALDKAFEVLQECRRTLKYTYPFAYYLHKSNQAEIFEANQADLERSTEILSGFLEHEIDPEKNITLPLMDKTQYCDKRRKTLLKHCKDGYSEHYWAGLDSY